MIDVRFVPLDHWPGEATRFRDHARFRASYQDTLTLLSRELTKLNARGIVIQAFFRPEQIRQDGWPYAKSSPSQPGVILSFRKIAKWDANRQSVYESFSFPCDRYRQMEDNLRAIALSLKALRAVDRYGVTRRAEQYTGWKQIEAPSDNGTFRSKEEAAAFMATQAEPAQASTATVNASRSAILSDAAYRQFIYRQAAARLHPDRGGDHELFVRLQEANRMLEAQ